MNPLALLAALVSGAFLPFQAASNREMGKTLGHALHGSLVNFIGGTVALLMVITIMRLQPNLDRIWAAPWWSWIGGLMGATMVTSAIVFSPKIGTVAFFAAMVCGQMLASLLVDSTGMMNMPRVDITWARVLGCLLVISGVILVTRA